jgi:hypothetical protein
MFYSLVSIYNAYFNDKNNLRIVYIYHLSTDILKVNNYRKCPTQAQYITYIYRMK